MSDHDKEVTVALAEVRQLAAKVAGLDARFAGLEARAEALLVEIREIVAQREGESAA